MASAANVVRCLVLAAILVAAAGVRSGDMAEAAVARDEAAFKQRAREVLDLLAAPAAGREYVDEGAPRGLADKMPQPEDVPRCFGHKWTYTGVRLGGGNVGSVWVVQGLDGEDYAMKGMRLRPEGTERAIARGIVPTLDGFADEVAAQTLAAEMHLAAEVVDYFRCRHPSSHSPTLGFIVMQKISGEDLGASVGAQRAETGVWCQQKYLPPASSIEGFITKAMYETIVDGVSRLDQAGIYITDMHPGNIMVEEANNTGGVFFIDFGFPSGCTYKEGQALVEALGKLGCPVREDLLPPSDSLEMGEGQRVMLKSNGWWYRGARIQETHGDGTYRVQDREGVIRDRVPHSHLFYLDFPECANGEASSSGGSFGFGFSGDEGDDEEDPFEHALADVRIHHAPEPRPHALPGFRLGGDSDQEDFVSDSSSDGSFASGDSDFELS